MNDKQKIADLERRLVLIEDDAKMLARHLELIQTPVLQDSNGSNYNNYLGNILECVDLKSDEHTQYLMWNEDNPNRKLTLPDAENLNKTALTMNSDYAQSVDNIIDKLHEIDVDGETMEFIVECVGLKEQLHSQLVGREDYINNLKAEKAQGNKKTEYNFEFHLKATAKKVWDDLHNNDHLIFNDFESYYRGKN